MEVQFHVDLCLSYLTQELDALDELAMDIQLLDISVVGKDRFKNYENKEHSLEVGSILSTLHDQKKKVGWIAGEHGVGKSTLSAFFLTSWNNKIKIKRLHEYKLVISISVSETSVSSATSIFKIIFPLSCFVVDVDNVMNKWLLSNQALIILDNINCLSKKSFYKLYDFIVDNPNITVLLFGRLHDFSKYAIDDGFKCHCIFMKLNGFKDEKVLNLSEDWIKSVPMNIPSLKAKLKSNMNRLGRILKYPSLLHETCEMWKIKHTSLQNVFTASELMWELLAWKAKIHLKLNIKQKGPLRKKFFQWLMLAGELSLCSLKLDLNLDKVSLEELEVETLSLFPENGKIFLGSIFSPSLTHSSLTCKGIPSSANKPVLEYFSSWFLVEQLLSDKRLIDVISGVTDPLPLILFSAGHLERLQEEGSITLVEERRLIKALVNYRLGSYEDFSFIQEFVAELKCIKRLVEIVIDETEYNEEWNLNVAEIQQKSLEVLLNHVSPTRLIFLADESKKNYELTSVMSYVCRIDISVWLDSIPQFTYGNTQKLDKLLQPFLEERVVPKLDLISGCLSSTMMKELVKSTATQNLVLLKLKVSNLKSLNVALSLPTQLPQLLWLELKLDMDLPEVSQVVSTKVELFDIHVRGLDASNITILTDLLMAIHLRYTGIHLEETSLTPENVFGLLKELSKRGVALRAEQESINKFRRWYYPSLTGLSSKDILTEKEYIDLIGHDDRKFYSDHCVTSSQFVTALDAWNLRNYLENQPKIVHFSYEASNIVFSKQLDGEVAITFKGDYKETVEGKVAFRIEG